MIPLTVNKIASSGVGLVRNSGRRYSRRFRYCSRLTEFGQGQQNLARLCGRLKQTQSRHCLLRLPRCKNIAIRFVAQPGSHILATCFRLLPPIWLPRLTLTICNGYAKTRDETNWYLFGHKYWIDFPSIQSFITKKSFEFFLKPFDLVNSTEWSLLVYIFGTLFFKGQAGRLKNILRTCFVRVSLKSYF